MNPEVEESAIFNVIIYIICVFTFLLCCFLIGGGLVFLLGVAGYILSVLNASIVYALARHHEEMNR